MPRYDDRPAAPAKIVNANPDTIWLARSVTHEERLDEPHRGPRQRGDGERGRKGAGLLDRPEAEHRADEHHPLDTKIEHAGALGEQLAESRIEERRAVDDRGGEHDDDDRVVDAGGQDHAAASARPERRSNAKR